MDMDDLDNFAIRYHYICTTATLLVNQLRNKSYYWYGKLL